MATLSKAERRQFALEVYEAAKRVSDINPIFVTAQAAWESGWGASRIGKYNIFGITKGSWTGPTILVKTWEVYKTDTRAFYPPEEVISVAKLNNGYYRYTVKRLFRDYRSMDEAIADHCRILMKPCYADAWPYRKSAEEFCKRIVDNVGLKYATDPNYYKSMLAMIASVKKLLNL